MQWSTKMCWNRIGWYKITKVDLILCTIICCSILEILSRRYSSHRLHHNLSACSCSKWACIFTAAQKAYFPQHGCNVHQRQDLDNVSSIEHRYCRRGGNCCREGVGKTVHTISLLTYIVEELKCNGPFLIIVPQTTLYNWISEINTWALSMSTVVYTGSQIVHQKATLSLRKQCHVVLITNELVPMMVQDVPKMNGNVLFWMTVINQRMEILDSSTNVGICLYRIIVYGSVSNSVF